MERVSVELDREQLWRIGLLGMRIKIAAERTLDKCLSDADHPIIEETAQQCFVEGERDDLVIYWKCLLELLDFEDVWDGIRDLLAARLH